MYIMYSILQRRKRNFKELVETIKEYKIFIKNNSLCHYNVNWLLWKKINGKSYNKLSNKILSLLLNFASVKKSCSSSKYEHSKLKKKQSHLPYKKITEENSW